MYSSWLLVRFTNIDLSKVYNLISIFTPAGISNFIKDSIVLLFGVTISIRRLWVLASNCSRESLCLWGERKIVMISFSVGKGIGPDTLAPVRFAVSTILDAFHLIFDDQMPLSVFLFFDWQPFYNLLCCLSFSQLPRVFIHFSWQNPAIVRTHLLGETYQVMLRNWFIVWILFKLARFKLPRLTAAVNLAISNFKALSKFPIWFFDAWMSI